MTKKFTPSERALSRYEELRKNLVIMRKTLSKRRARLEKEVPVGNLPALVLPETPKTYRKLRQSINWRKMNAKRFWSMISELNKITTGGIEGWYKEHYKKTILKLWSDNLIGVEPEGGFKTKSGAGTFYSKEQIENSSMGRYMEVFNMIQRLTMGEFMALYDLNIIPEFRYIYRDFQNGNDASAFSRMNEFEEVIGNRRILKVTVENYKNIVEPKSSKLKKSHDEVKSKKDDKGSK